MKEANAAAPANAAETIMPLRNAAIQPCSTNFCIGAGRLAFGSPSRPRNSGEALPGTRLMIWLCKRTEMVAMPKLPPRTLACAIIACAGAIWVVVIKCQPDASTLL